jgi:16S rRNA C967 or C1407 C5-methylase (RsmB/RsmF family)/NOL1/NOP2/fmu family ribosome biogenesis protein
MARRTSKPVTSTDGTDPPIPPLFLQRMQTLLGRDYAAFAATFEQPPRSGLRVNTLKLAPAEFANLAPFPLQPLPWPPEGFLVTDEAQPGKHPYHAAGLYYLQDPAAMVPAALLAPQPGDRVLDLSAAPGGKATHLASLLRGTGLLVANEIHLQRARDLSENLERWGARNVAISNETPERLAATYPDFFDRVLVDAPCSGEGMLRKSAAARAEWAPALVQGCATRQSSILASAAQTVRPGGILAYVTCTFAPQEDEGTVARFLAERPDFSLLQSPVQPGFAPGRPDWLPSEEQRPDLARAVRLWPQSFPGEGHFFALLQREPGAEAAPMQAASPADRRRADGQRRSGQSTEGLPRARQQLYLAFCAEHLTTVPAESRLAVTGTYLYQSPAGLPSTGGLRYLHPGWWLGEFKKERFEPSHALALALRPAEVRQTMDFDPAGPEVLAYLRGETLPGPGGSDGWVLVTVAHYGLGWGKRVRGILKSHYPRGLRRY